MKILEASIIKYKGSLTEIQEWLDFLPQRFTILDLPGFTKGYWILWTRENGIEIL